MPVLSRGGVCLAEGECFDRTQSNATHHQARLPPGEALESMSPQVYGANQARVCCEWAEQNNAQLSALAAGEVRATSRLKGVT